MSKVFISHANADKPLVQALEVLLENGIGINHKEIFCTSLEGQGIPPGVDFKTFIAEKLKDTDVVVALISENFYASNFCMCELGATWIQANRFIPLLAPPMTFKDLKAVLSGVQALRLDNTGDVDTFCESLKPLAGDNFNVPRWTVRREEFLVNLPTVLKKIDKPKTVKLEEYEKLFGENEQYKKEFAKIYEENEVVKAQNEKLSKLKDSKEVSQILLENMSAKDQFEKLVAVASEEIGPLPRVVKEALYQSFKGRHFVPDQDEFDSAERAVEEGYLVDDEPGFSLRSEHPRIKKAYSAIKRLQDFLADECPPEFVTLYEQENNELLDLTVRPFWQRHLLV